MFIPLLFSAIFAGDWRGHAQQPSWTCCDSLSKVLPGKVALTSTTTYNATLADYWSLQEGEITPNCILRPETSEDVSKAVSILTSPHASSHGQCKFAVKSGGHTPFYGAANIDDGVTIDLALLNQVTVSDDNCSVTIGPGNTWGRVYKTLPPGLATGGGRAAQVGVGGLTLGGGVSFFSDRYGFVCDTVRRFEVVLASGQIVNATATSNRDLWLALKGGSNNFGIVTAFSQDVFPQSDFWGGLVFSSPLTFPAQFTAFEAFTNNPSPDPYAALIMSFSYVPQLSQWIGARDQEYTKPVPSPPAFENFTTIANISSTMRISNISDFTHEVATIGNPPNFRNQFLTATYRPSAALLAAIFQTGNATVQTLKSAGLVAFTISFQPVTKNLLHASAAAGGNSLGLSGEQAPLFNFLLTVTWQNATNDAVVLSKTRELYESVGATAVEMGLQHPYRYLNYAAEWQDPISGYGEEVRRLLRRTSRKYDREGVFQRLVPGGFKLFT